MNNWKKNVWVNGTASFKSKEIIGHLYVYENNTKERKQPSTHAQLTTLLFMALRKLKQCRDNFLHHCYLLLLHPLLMGASSPETVGHLALHCLSPALDWISFHPLKNNPLAVFFFCILHFPSPVSWVILVNIQTWYNFFILKSSSSIDRQLSFSYSFFSSRYYKTIRKSYPLSFPLFPFSFEVQVGSFCWSQQSHQ